MTSIGEILRAERESQGRTISQVADALCITPTYVRAMESGDVSAIPGVFFYRSFVRQYATLLGLDSTKLQLSLPSDSEPSPGLLVQEEKTARPQLSQTLRHSIGERLLSQYSTAWSVAGLVVVLAACSLFYEWWVQAPQRQSTQNQVAVKRPRRTAAPAPQIALQTVAGVSSDSVNNVVLDVAATEKTWLSITSGGREIFSGVLLPSQSKTLSASDAATMRIGNAAGIEVRLNGKPVGPLGTRGQVRTVHFTPQQFEIVPAAERL